MKQQIYCQFQLQKPEVHFVNILPNPFKDAKVHNAFITRLKATLIAQAFCSYGKFMETNCDQLNCIDNFYTM